MLCFAVGDRALGFGSEHLCDDDRAMSTVIDRLCLNLS